MEKKKPNTAHTALELNIISCHDLKANYFLRKLNTFVSVSIIEDDYRNPKQQTLITFPRTPTDRTGDRNPQWNHAMKLDLQTIPDENVSIMFKVMCENVFRDSKIGSARLPLDELLCSHKNLRILKFSVKDGDQKGRGQLNVSYKFSGETEKIGEDKIVQMKSCSSMKFNTNTVSRPVQKIEWPILRTFSLISNMEVEEEEKKKSSQEGSYEMKSLSFSTGFDQPGKNYKKYGLSGSTKWDIQLDPRAGRFPGLLAPNQSQCSY